MTAKYKWLAEIIRQQIRTGELKAGDALPSTSQLRALHGISPSSIRSAILVLQTEGWVVGAPGEARYVAPNPPIGDHD